MKKCTKCKESKNLEDFHVRSGAPDGRRGVCKGCKNAVNRKNTFLLKDVEKVPPLNGLKICCTCKVEKELIDFSGKSSSRDGYMRRCKECVAEHHQKTKHNSAITQKVYYEANKKVINDYKLRWVTERTKNDLLYRLKINIRSSISSSLKRKKFKKEDASIDILKLSIADFKTHLESQFENWMSWDSYGDACGDTLEYNCSIDLDHIIPISYAKNEDEVYLLNHWSNFQPLCSKVNRDIKKATVYPCTNLELKITFWEDHWEYI